MLNYSMASSDVLLLDVEIRATQLDGDLWLSEPEAIYALRQRVSRWPEGTGFGVERALNETNQGPL